jgi:hypothetical protein
MIPRPHLLSLALALTLAAPLAARDGGQVPARFGLQQLEDRFGRPAIRQIVEMTGTAGDPQPREWRVTAIAPGRSDLLREFWIGEERVTDEGLSDDFYPDRLPKGFLSLERMKLDSTQAFAMTEQVARDAGIGFDVINYKLHCREYTDEPIWTLTLLDREDTIVGSVHMSADTGRILRSVWMRRLPNGRLAVEDSARGDTPPAQIKSPGVASIPGDIPPSETPVEPVVPEDPVVPPPDAEPAKEEPAPTTDDGEIPEIKKLQEAQEKTGDPVPPADPAVPEPQN